MTSDELHGDERHDEVPAQEGLAWSWDLDLDAVLAAAGVQADPAGSALNVADDDRVEADFAEYLEARDSGRAQVVPLPVMAGRVAESLPTGPGLAGWLACGEPGDLDEWALPGVAASYRRLAGWAQAGELAAVARLASRSAASDDQVGADEDGRPSRVTSDACGQVSLALTMSQSAASWWTDLAVTLQWRLPDTGAALRSGTIDLSRARTIADATSVLDEEKARAVEAKVLPKAGHQTLGQLRSALRRAVIAADPEGADQRRQDAERKARVAMYPDEEGTASLAGYSLPGVRAAAAMARITALARALKASGVDGGIDLLRSKVFLGLLLGTLPYIPPPPQGPHDQDLPPDSDPPEDSTPEDSTPEDSTPHDSTPENSTPGDAGDNSPGESTAAHGGPGAPGLEGRLPEECLPGLPAEECLPEECPAEDGPSDDDDVPEDFDGMEASDSGVDEGSGFGENDDEESGARPLAWPPAYCLLPAGSRTAGEPSPDGRRLAGSANPLVNSDPKLRRTRQPVPAGPDYPVRSQVPGPTGRPRSHRAMASHCHRADGRAIAVTRAAERARPVKVIPRRAA